MTTENLITPAQLRKLMTTLRNMKLSDERGALIEEWTNGRVRSAKHLTKDEAADIINRLEPNDSCKRMVRKIFAIGYGLGWLQPHQGSLALKKRNEFILDKFICRRGVKRKRLVDYRCDELPDLVNQFISIETKYKKQSENEFETEITSILNELGVSRPQSGNSIPTGGI